jgi:hypothetical protein
MRGFEGALCVPLFSYSIILHTFTLIYYQGYITLANLLCMALTMVFKYMLNDVEATRCAGIAHFLIFVWLVFAEDNWKQGNIYNSFFSVMHYFTALAYLMVPIYMEPPSRNPATTKLYFL